MINLTKRKSRHIKKVSISFAAIEDMLLKNGSLYYTIEDGLPESALLVKSFVDNQHDVLVLWYYDESFPSITIEDYASTTTNLKDHAVCPKFTKILCNCEEDREGVKIFCSELEKAIEGSKRGIT